jgi:hypothetical protein
MIPQKTPQQFSAGPHHHAQQNQLMDMLKMQMMSMMMLRYNNDSTSSSSSMFNIVYGMLVVAVVEKILEVIPICINYIQQKFNQKLEESQKKLLDAVQDVKVFETTDGKTVEKKIKGSIRFFFRRNTTATANDQVICDAILDFITNLPETENVAFFNNSYHINNTNEILIDKLNDVYAHLKKSFTFEGGDNVENSQILDIYSYCLEINELRKFINNIVAQYQRNLTNKLGNNLFYFSHALLRNSGKISDYSRLPPQLTFNIKQFITNRKFHNVLGMQSKLIQKRVEFFRNNKRWYDDKGVPYTLGLLLCGPPGGGKTSTIKCIANELQRHIITINFNNDLTKTQLENLFFNETITVVMGNNTQTFTIPVDKRLYVIEDVDCDNNDIVLDRNKAEKEKEKKKQEQMEMETQMEMEKLKQMEATLSPLQDTRFQYTMTGQQPLHNMLLPAPKNQTVAEPVIESPVDPEKLTLSHLLNVLDGVLETPGRVLIMTSNYPGKLDKALIRPGRIDLITEFERCNHATMQEFIEVFYDVKLTETEIEGLKRNTVEYVLTPAEMTKIMFEHFESYKEALKFLEENSKVFQYKEETADFLQDPPPLSWN